MGLGSQKAEPIDRVLAALGHPIRRRIVMRLATGGEASITDLAAPFDVSLMAISKHVKVLRAAGVVEVQREGRTHWCRANYQTLQYARDWLDHHGLAAARMASGPA